MTSQLAEKIDAELLEVISKAKKNELIPINVSLVEVNEEEIYAAFKEDTGFDYAILQDEELFNELIGDRIVSMLEQKVGVEETHRKVNVEAPDYQLPSSEVVESLRDVLCNDLKEFISDTEGIIEALSYDRSISIADYAILQARQTLQAARLRSVKAVRTAANEAFISKYVDTKANEIVYSSRYISTVFMKATKETIVALANANETVFICYDDPDLFAEPDLSIAGAQVGVDEITGTKSSNFNNGYGFWGTGINVGILEAGGVINTTSPHYSSTRMTQVANGTISMPADTHASLVTSIIAGNKVVFNEVTYSGVVPYASVFYTRGNTQSSCISGLDALADRNVNVINMSLGIASTAYNSFDRDLDAFINNTGIVCVKSAGNDAVGYGTGTNGISSPGYALNCITVGNLETKSNATTASSSPYSLHASSSWEEPGAIPNKPDICAPGTWIRAVRSTSGSNNFFYDSESGDPIGTSFAAPFITGVVVQMMQEHSAKIGKPMAVKAKIMNIANRYIVSTTNNPIEGSSFLREKSGAGLVDAKKAMSGTAYKYAWNHQAIQNNYVTQLTISLSAGQRMRATLVFSNKNTSVIIEHMSDFYDIDLRIVDANTGDILYYSNSCGNNVEIIDYTTNISRTVYVQTCIKQNVSGVTTDWALEVDKW